MRTCSEIYERTMKLVGTCQGFWFHVVIADGSSNDMVDAARAYIRSKLAMALARKKMGRRTITSAELHAIDTSGTVFENG